LASDDPEQMTTASADTTQLDLHCPQCGYNLRGIESSSCPECGLTIDRAAFAESQLPWSHRKRLGYVRAYVRTAVMAMLDSQQLASEVARPVSFRDAQKFRFITILIAWLPHAAIAIFERPLVVEQFTAVLRGGANFIPPQLALFWPWFIGALAPGVGPVALGVLLILLSGVASYYFHPRSVVIPLQNRAIALSYYASAPLILAPIVIGLPILATQLNELFWHNRVPFSVVSVVNIGALLFAPIALVGWWLSTVRLHRRIVHQYGGGSLLLAFTLPIAWVICVLFSLGALVWVIGYVILVFRSFA
jgi:hypothetical protein